MNQKWVEGSLENDFSGNFWPKWSVSGQIVTVWPIYFGLIEIGIFCEKMGFSDHTVGR